MNEQDMNKQNNPLEPDHVAGTTKGEETVQKHGAEAGREKMVGATAGDEPVRSRTARDATGVNAGAEDPIDPAMPDMPPP